MCSSTSRSVCLFVCLGHNSKMNDPKLFKLGIGNDLERLKGQRSRLGLGLGLAWFELYECLLVT